jgi:hypothetical protein
MNKYILLLISFLAIGVFSCKKDTTIPTSGIITLSSQQVADGSAYATYGLSFIAGALHKYPEQQVDVLVLALKPAGDITALFFTAPDYNTGTFNNTYYNQDLTAAETQFNEYSEVTVTDFKPLSDTLKVGQIITYKSAANKYAKILIRSIAIVKIIPPYAEVNISWVNQPNGTSKF